MKARLIVPFSLALVPLAILAGCGGGGGSSSSTAPGSASAGGSGAKGGSAAVDVAQNAKLGSILVDSRGRTLYLFQKDAANRSNCAGMCAQIWPPLTASGKPSGGNGVNAGMLGTTKRSDGSTQVTYNGHPLYTYTADTSPGQVNGNGINTFGGVWNAVTPNGTNASAGGSGAASSSSGGGNGSSSSGGGYGY
jgi:predicted lipoprotein with Yx(FWY)xxD motif